MSPCKLWCFPAHGKSAFYATDGLAGLVQKANEIRIAPEQDFLHLIEFQQEDCSHLLSGYDRPRDLRYFFVFLSPILDAFFFTVSSDRPNLAATLAVGLLGKSFLSKATSLFDHKTLTSFFFAMYDSFCLAAIAAYLDLV